ncbi:MAG: transglutaminase family protein [Planctomycetota bacterium]|jgi:hypothetical protein
MMSQPLRCCLLALVILNLVFVHITQAVSLVWILPLYVAAAAAPVLWPLQKYLTYRLAWNVGLMAIFALLLQHIATAGGVRHLLEDGLRLAAFCQVHILNNLARQKKPDLIFFNSFLIAIVTSLFCQDLIYSIVFVIYAAVLILSLQIAATEIGGTRLTASVKPEIRSSLWHSLIGLSVTMLVFIFLPRDFEREGLVEEQLLSSSGISEIGFTEQIRLDNKGLAVATNTVVLRARLKSGDKDDLPPHWRGITYLWPVPGGWGGENRWQSTRLFSLDQEWRRGPDSSWQRPGHETTVSVEVDFLDRTSTRLFLPLEVHGFDINANVHPKIDGNFKLMRYRHSGKGPLSYRFLVCREAGRPRNSRYIQPYRFADHVHLPQAMVPTPAEHLYDSLRSGVPANAVPAVVADIFARHLSENYSYLLPGENGAAKTLDEFLRQKGGGHCEYFASVMMILLRKHGIPCRLVGGYLAHEWNTNGTVLTVRKRDAHAWVEAWDKNVGWFTVDATPARDVLAATEVSLWEQIGLTMSALWDQVRSFDSDTRGAALAWLELRAKAIGSWCWQHPFLIVFLAALALALHRLHRRWHTPFQEPAVLDYVTALRRAGLKPRDAETPRQLLTRARTMDLTPAKLEMLVDATARHERQRYV